MNGFDNETLTTIQKTAVEASGAQGKAVVLELPAEPDGNYAILKPDGSIIDRVAKPRPRRHHLEAIGEIDDFLKHVADRLSFQPTLWYSKHGITIILNDVSESRLRERCTVRLEPTEEFRTLVELGAHPTQFTQRDFIRLFRIRLAACVATDDRIALIKVLRVLDFSESVTGHSKIERSRESMGSDIEAETRSAAGEIPDEITLQVRLYDDPQLTRRLPIRCAIEINVREQNFELLPLAGEITRAWDEQMDDIGSHLDNDLSIPVFWGKP